MGLVTFLVNRRLKAYDCITHDLLIANFATYRFGDNTLIYLNLFITGKQEAKLKFNIQILIFKVKI